MSLLGGRSATWSANMSSNTWSANMSSNSRNVKLPFLTTRCHYQGVDLPLDLPIWALTVEMWNCHSWPLDVTTRGVDLPIWALTLDLPIWALMVRNVKLPFLNTRCHYWGGRSATWSANMSSNSRNVKLPFLTNRCLLTREVDLPLWALTLDLPIWALTFKKMWNCHSWPLDVTTKG